VVGQAAESREDVCEWMRAEDKWEDEIVGFLRYMASTIGVDEEGRTLLDRFAAWLDEMLEARECRFDSER
jgi:hypothetical protein